jgi:hypothetical protein
VSRLASALALVLAALSAGCGARSPQAPAPTAARVAEALSGIAAACGERAQLDALPAFGPVPGKQRAILAAASMRAAELRHAVAENPAWIYQDRTLAEVASLARERLRECGLGAAAVGL